MSYTIQLRRDTSANWTSLNPVLAQGELGYETDTGHAKMGNGATAWNSLAYWTPSASGGSVTSVFGRSGVVVAANADYTVGQVTGAAPLASPTFTGTPTAPTASALDASTRLATTAYADSAVGAETTRATTAEAGKANIAGGVTFTGGAVAVSGNPLTGHPIVSSGLTGATAASRYAGATTGGPPNTGTFAVGDFVLDQLGGWWICTAAGSPGTWVSGGGNDYVSNQQITAGETVWPRFGLGTSATLTSQTMTLDYWTATRSETINNLSVVTGATAAGATPTYCAMAVFSVAGNGNLTQVAITANDTTLFAAGNTQYTRATTSAWSKIGGQRYAFAILIVTAAATPNFLGYNGTLALASTAPRLVGNQTGQSTIPASVTAGSVGNTAVGHFAAVLP